MLKKLTFCTFAAAAMAGATAPVFAQPTNPPPRAVPFTETFASGVPSNFAGWNGINGNNITSQSLAEGSIPTGNATPILSAPSTTGGLFYDAVAGNIGQTYSTNASNGADQWAFAISTTGASGLTLSYDLATFVVAGRPAQMVAQYRIGHTDPWTTLPAVTGNPYTSGALNEVVHVSMALPAAIENQSEVQIRFANWRGSGSGSSSRYTTDNVSVTGGAVDPNVGACCDPAGPCNPVLLAACTTGTFQGPGTSCSPNPCPQPPGSCCVTGAGCQLVTSPVDCSAATGGSNFVANGTCTPGPCIPPTPVAVQACDIAFAADNSAATATLFQIRGAGSTSPSIVGSWEQNPFIEFVRFDNAAGINHNASGNLLGLDFGSGTGGGPLFSYATDGSNNAQLILDQTGFNSIFNLPSNPRVGGLSISPGNNRIAVTGYDAAAIAVLSYNAGVAPGTGGGASVTGGAALTTLAYLTSPKGTYGTAWLDNDTLLVFVPMGGQVVKLFSIPVSGIDGGIAFGAPVERASINDPGADAGRTTALVYNPQQAPYIFALSSASAASTSTNTLYIIDPSTWAISKQLNLSTSLQTGRDLALGCDHNLYLSTHVDTGRALIGRLVLDTNADGTISPAEIAALADNSTTDFFSNSMVAAPGFSGIDVGISGVVVAQGACCDSGAGVCTPSLTAAACTAQGGVYQSDNSTCSPNPCAQPPMGVCCRGVTCVVTPALQSQAACEGSLAAGVLAGAKFVAAVPCGDSNHLAPCCYADYNKNGTRNVSDIFAFLTDWFAGRVYAVVGGDGSSGTPAVSHIFSFLTDWFAGGCG